MATIAFDVYGTLIDTDGVVSRLREWIDVAIDVVCLGTPRSMISRREIGRRPVQMVRS